MTCKDKFKRNDFDLFAEHIGLNEKQIANAYEHISSHIPEALNFIDLSFISDNRKCEFKDLITERASRLGL